MLSLIKALVCSDLSKFLKVIGSKIKLAKKN